MTPPKDQTIRPRVLGETLTQAVKPKKKLPVGMTTAEWQVHRITHLPHNAACR